MRDDAVLQAVARYAEYGDPGAARYLRRIDPFGKWNRRADVNREIADEDAAPEELMEEISEALDRLQPAEREALREALKRSD